MGRKRKQRKRKKMLERLRSLALSNDGKRKYYVKAEVLVDSIIKGVLQKETRVLDYETSQISAHNAYLDLLRRVNGLRGTLKSHKIYNDSRKPIHLNSETVLDEEEKEDAKEKEPTAESNRVIAAGLPIPPRYSGTAGTANIPATPRMAVLEVLNNTEYFEHLSPEDHVMQSTELDIKQE